MSPEEKDLKIERLEQESWAKSMKKFLLLACNYKHRYPKGVPKNIIARLDQLYEQILQRGLDFHHTQPPLTHKSNRGRELVITCCCVFKITRTMFYVF